MGNEHRNVRGSVWTSRRVTRSASKIRVPVVDDNVAAAEALAPYLSLEGMECEAAFGGPAAVSLATEFKPHVVVMDISMPGYAWLPGGDGLKKRRADERGRDRCMHRIGGSRTPPSRRRP